MSFILRSISFLKPANGQSPPSQVHPSIALIVQRNWVLMLVACFLARAVKIINFTALCGCLRQINTIFNFVKNLIDSNTKTIIDATILTMWFWNKKAKNCIIFVVKFIRGYVPTSIHPVRGLTLETRGSILPGTLPSSFISCND